MCVYGGKVQESKLYIDSVCNDSITHILQHDL